MIRIRLHNPIIQRSIATINTQNKCVLNCQELSFIEFNTQTSITNVDEEKERQPHHSS